MDFDPVLRYGYRKRMEDSFILRSQELISGQIISFPLSIWWSSMPSLLKGWIDRVSPGIDVLY